MKKRILLTVILLILGFLSFGPIAEMQQKSADSEQGIQSSLTQKSRQILGVWATLKVVNGVINVLQSAEIGVNVFAEVSINPLEFLGPVDNVLDKLSDLLLFAMGAIVIEKLILALAGFAVCKVVVPVCIALCIFTMWVKKESARIRSIIPLFVLIAFSVSIAVPLSFQIAATVENKLLTNRVNTVLSGISEKGKSAESMENEVSGIKKIGKSIVSFLSTAKDLGNALAEDLINYIIIFFVTNILIPIVTIYALLSVTKYCAKLMLGNMSVPLPAPITPIAKNKIKP